LARAPASNTSQTTGCAKLAQQAGLPGGPDHTRHHMPIGGKQRDQPDADDAAGPGDEDPHSTTA